VRQVGNGKTYYERYDKLILSPGARPFVPPVPGVDLPGVFQLRSVPDMDAIKAQVDSGWARSAVVVGGGFIGLEMADNLAQRGLDVAVAEMLDQVMMPLDPEMASLVHQHLRLKNGRLALGDGLKGIASPNGQLAVTLASGKTLLADMVVLSVGVRPDSDLAKDAGLELGPRGHIAVDEAMRTSDPNIYAVGDAVQVQCAVAGGRPLFPLPGRRIARRALRPTMWQAYVRPTAACKAPVSSRCLTSPSVLQGSTPSNSAGMARPFVA
jgi:NADPH-dependent 2,4-dienoyl-CoA reductase/sulfur reductase-like enzyme